MLRRLLRMKWNFCFLIRRSDARLSSDSTSASERLKVDQTFGSLARG
jgi:hypothetical protein